MPPDIAHISIARFSKSIDLDEAARSIQALEIDCSEFIAAFSLLKDLTPPDFNAATIDTFPLAR